MKQSNSETMKIAWLHPHFNNWMGGHQYILEVAKRLKKKYDIKIFASTASPDAIAKFKTIGIDLETISNTSTYNPFYWLFLPYYLHKEINFLKEKFILSEVEGQKPFDVIISSYFPSNIWANNLNIKHLQICFEPLAFFYDENFLKGFSLIQRISFKILKIIYKHLDKNALNEADYVLTISTFNKNWIKKVYGRSDVSVTYEGVDCNFFKPAKTSKQNIILHSTDFTKIKGTDFLIVAMPKIIKDFPKIKLVITQTLENNPGKKRLINKARLLGVDKNIEFAGKVSYKNLVMLYNKARLLIQPSINQSMSLTVKEAMSCQTPVITCMEGWEQTKNGEAGFLVNSQKPGEIADAAVKILKDKKLAQKVGRRGRAIILEKFTWDKVAQKIQNAIKP